MAVDLEVTVVAEETRAAWVTAVEAKEVAAMGAEATVVATTLCTGSCYSGSHCQYT